MLLRECRTLTQCGWKSFQQSPNAAGRVSDTITMRLGECPTLSHCGLESVGHSHNPRLGECRHFHNAAGRLSDTLVMRLGECPTLSQCGWKSVGQSPNAAWRVSNTLVMRLRECPTLSQCVWENWAYYNCDSSTIGVRFERDSSTIRARHATTRYEVFRAIAYEIDSSTPRESVVAVSCMLIDSSMHTIFTFYLYRPTLHRVCEYARNCLYKRN